MLSCYYNFRFDSTDESVSESGSQVLPQGATEPGATKTGRFSYTSPEGNLITLSYVADENGFVPSTLNIGPPMPETKRAVEEPQLPMPEDTHLPQDPVDAAPQLHLPAEPFRKTFVQTPEYLI